MELWFMKRGYPISIETLNSLLHIVYVEKKRTIGMISTRGSLIFNGIRY
jgi:hypothetical protein